MELNKQQLRRVRDRHHRRHGIKPAAARVARDARRFLARSFNVREGRAPYHVIRKRFVIVAAAWALVGNARQSAIAAATQTNATRSRPAQLIR